MKPQPVEGRILKYHSNVYTVAVVLPDGTERLYDCLVKATLKKQKQDVLTGDWVELDSVDESPMGSADLHTGERIMADRGSARIVRVLDRRNQLTRPKVANVDQVLILHPLREPYFDPQQLDRLLTQVQLAGQPLLLCLTKADLCNDPAETEAILDQYQQKLQLQVWLTSTRQPQSVAKVLPALLGKTTVLAGISGAGKSSLLNTLHPGLNLKVGEVSEKIERGQHTTRHVELLRLPQPRENKVVQQTYLADTPGFSYLSFDTLMPEEFASRFWEFTQFEDSCSFRNCLHLPPQTNLEDMDEGEDPAESGCQLSPWFLQDDPASTENDEGVFELKSENPIITPSRYDSYLAMLGETLVYKERFQTRSSKVIEATKRQQLNADEHLNIIRLSGKLRAPSRRRERQAILPQALREAEDDTKQVFEEVIAIHE